MTGKRLTAFLTSIVMFVMIIIPSVPQANAAEAMRDITTMELVRDMGIGINLGNTLEACGDWVNGKTPADYEIAWGSPIVTEEMIRGYKNAGFGVLRIPVAW
ncbi:MAG: glycoside hydrolase family 5 protein, partial [Oscillospiraceae bacterium]|nr:glycoside hydrolase family 5 protein [Oscillospiraceae bacterium]